MRLGHADGQVAPALFGEEPRPTPGLCRPSDRFRAVHAPGQSQGFLFDGSVQLVGVVHPVWRGVRIGSCAGDGLGQGHAALAAVGEAGVFRRRVGAGVSGDFSGRLQFFGAVAGETVQRHYARQPEGPHVVDMVDHVGRAGFHSVQVGLTQLSPGRAAVPTHRAYRRYQHRRAHRQVALARLDVHELLESQVGTESRLGDDVVGVTHRHPVGNDGTAPVGNVSERPGVDDGRLALHRLHQVGHDGVPHHGHQ